MQSEETQGPAGSVKRMHSAVDWSRVYSELHPISIEAQKKYFPKPSFSLVDKRSIHVPLLISPKKGHCRQYSVFSKALDRRSVRLLPWQCCILEFDSVRQPASRFHHIGSPQRIRQLSFSKSVLQGQGLGFDWTLGQPRTGPRTSLVLEQWSERR